MAEDGSVYDTEAECEAYEAAYNLHKIIRSNMLLSMLDTITQNYVITEVVKFINENKSTVARYIEAGSNPQTISYQLDIFDHGKDRLVELARNVGGGEDGPQTAPDRSGEQD